MTDDRLRIEYIPLDIAMLWDNNKKRHDIGGLIQSFQRHGFKDSPKYEPELNNGQGGIVEGNGRFIALDAMRRQGDAPPRGIAVVDDEWHVPVTFGVDAASEAAAQAYGVDHNALTLTGGDFDIGDHLRLWEASFVDDLQGLAELDELPTFLDGGDLDALLAMEDNNNAGADTAPQIDKAQELLEKWQVAPGQLWQLGEHRVICGDCTDKGVVERVMGGEKAGIMVTDPPYAVKYDPQWRTGLHNTNYASGEKIANDDSFEWLSSFGFYCTDIVYIWCASWFIPRIQNYFESLSHELKYLIVWNKDLQIIGRGNYHWKHELCLYFVRRGQKTMWAGRRDQTTVWDIPAIHSFKNGETRDEWGILGHGNQKPLECMQRPIRNHDIEIAYDPFLGSGTTLIACQNLNRKCRGIEIEPKYIAVTLQRFLDHTGIEPVLIG